MTGHDAAQRLSSLAESQVPATLRGNDGHTGLMMQSVEPIGPVLNLCRMDDSCQLLLSLVQAYRLLQVMVQSLARVPHRMRLYETILRGTGRQVWSSAGNL